VDLAAMKISGLAVAALLASGTASAGAVEDAQVAELDRLRGEVAGQVHLAAYDLVDELVYRWTQQPIFESPTPVVLAGVTVPVGLGTGIGALLENHVAGVLGANPTTQIQLVHCPACTAVVVHSAAENTVVSRGYDNPAVLEQLGTQTGQHALFIDVEAEGTWLVLRARITQLTPELPIVWSHTLTTSAGTPALLREASDLKSAEEARREYLDALNSRGPVTVPVRFVVRSYARPTEETGTPPPPFLWLQTGAELSVSEGGAWTTSLLAGFSFIPQAYQGLMAQARVSRLVTSRVRSQTHPDLYLFAGAAVMNVWGPATQPFQEERLTADELIVNLDEELDPRFSFGALHVGADLRVGSRVGFSAFLENLPSLARSKNMGEYTNIFGIGFQSLGTEVTVCF